MDRKLTIEEIRSVVKAGQEVTVARGVIARGSGFQISFTFKGRRRKETLRLPITKPNLQYAIDTRSAIIRQIQLNGTFDYHEFFPGGKNAHLYGITPSKKTVKEALEEYLKEMNGKLAFSTWEDYRKSVHNQLIPIFGPFRLPDLSVLHIQKWVNGRTSTVKRTRNVLIPLSEVLEEAARTGIIPRNPLRDVRIKAHSGSQEINEDEIEAEIEDEDNVDPFTLSEINAILASAMETPQFYNLVQFAFWTGLRTSELIALRWNHIDLDAGTLRVVAAKVRGRLKRPKTKAGRRTVKLLPLAIEALRRQYVHTGKAGKEVFHDPRYNEPWSGDKPIRETFWRPILKRAGVRYRKPYQTRHTYASMLLSAGENPLWVAQQMGHEDWGMLRKHYGHWLPDYDRDAGALAVSVWDAFQKNVPETSHESGDIKEILIRTGS